LGSVLTQARASLLRRPAVRWLLVVGGLGALGYALFRSWGELGDQQWELKPVPLLFAFVCLVGVDFWVAALWVFTLRGLGGHLPLGYGVRIVLLSNLGKYVPGKVVHVVSQVMLAANRGVPTSMGISSVLVELALSLMGACVVILLSIPVLLEDYRSILVPLAAVGVPIGLVALHPRVLHRLLLVARNIVPGARSQELPKLPQYGVTLQLFAGYTMSWVLMAIALYAVAASVYPVGADRLLAMGGIVAISYVFGLVVPFAPAGLGAREGVTILLLSSFMPVPAAIVASVLYRVVSITADAGAAALGSRL